VSEDHDRRARRDSAQVVLHPGDLFISELAHSFELHHVHESNKVNAFVSEAVPAFTLGAFPITVQVLFAIVDRSVMFAGYIENLLGSGALKDLIHRVELG
jgi:hypothetical protein